MAPQTIECHEPQSGDGTTAPTGAGQESRSRKERPQDSPGNAGTAQYRSANTPLLDLLPTVAELRALDCPSLCSPHFIPRRILQGINEQLPGSARAPLPESDKAHTGTASAPGAEVSHDGTKPGRVAAGERYPAAEDAALIAGLKQRAAGAVPILDNRHSIPSPRLQIPGRKTASEVFTNARAKVDPRTGEIVQYVIASRPIFKADPDVEADPVERIREIHDGDTEGKLRAAKRAKSRLYDLCLYNDFDVFFTLTLNDEKINGYDYALAVRRTSQWCDNMVRRHGFRYVMVPELHKSGRLHIHGMGNLDALRLEEARRENGRLIKDKAGRQVYHVTNWGYGYTTAVKLDGTYEAVCMYIAKYMTKSECEAARGTIAGRYYYHSHNLREPGYIYFNALSVDELGEETKCVEINGAGLSLRYVRPVASSAAGLQSVEGGNNEE